MDLIHSALAVLGVGVVSVIAWLRWKLGKTVERAEQAETKAKQVEEVLKHVESKQEIKRDVVTSSEPVNDRLLNKWSRD